MKILVLINFADRAHCSPETLQRIEAFFAGQGVSFRLVKFASGLDSQNAINRAAEEGVDTLLMGGGDGTVHNVFNQAFDKGFTFGIIPLGMVNALARSLGIPTNPLEACKVALGGYVRKIDVGRAAGRWFTCFASVGFDASVVHTLNERAKVRWEKAAFAVQGIRRLFHLGEIQPFDARIFPEEKNIRGFSLIISNIKNYAGFNIFGDEPDDGKMEIIVFRRNRIADYVIGIGEMFHSRNTGHSDSKRLFRTYFTNATLRYQGRLFLQLDGEPIFLEPGTDLTFNVMPRAAPFLVPRKLE